MVAPTNQRLDNLEERVKNLEGALSGVMGKLDAQETNIGGVVTRALEDVVARMERRMDQFREEQQTVATTTRREQDAFRTEIQNLVNKETPLFQNTPNPETNHDVASEISKDGNRWSTGGGTGGKYRRLEMPVFDGNDPDEWLVRTEHYFSFYKLEEREKLQAAAVAMVGDALRWFQWENRRRPWMGWTDLSRRLLHQFRPQHAGTLHEQWLAVNQTTTVADYQKRFIGMAAPLTDIPETVMLGQFINGLKEDIKAEIRVMNPFNLEQTMDLATRIEERNRVGLVMGGKSGASKSDSEPRNSGSRASGPGGSQPVQTPSSPISKPPLESSQNSINMGRSINSGSQGGNEPKKLSEREYQDKRARGLCFKCDERFTIGHVCKNKGLSIMLVDEEDGEWDPP